jgi:LytR cell envelope-related transcriptional attenuator
MAKSAARKPLPALAFLLALSLLTALVWWRVLHRSDDSHQAVGQSSCPATVAPTAVPAPASVTVNVLNSTQRSGLAAGIGQSMSKLGFKVSTVANDQTSRAPVTGVAEVRFGTTGKAAATLVSYYVPGATLVPDGRADASVDLALGAKFVGLATPAAVTKALAAAHLTQLKPTAKASGSAVKSTSKAATPSTTARSSSSASTSATAPTTC